MDRQQVSRQCRGIEAAHLMCLRRHIPMTCFLQPARILYGSILANHLFRFGVQQWIKPFLRSEHPGSHCFWRNPHKHKYRLYRPCKWLSIWSTQQSREVGHHTRSIFYTLHEVLSILKRWLMLARTTYFVWRSPVLEILEWLVILPILPSAEAKSLAYI